MITCIFMCLCQIIWYLHTIISGPGFYQSLQWQQTGSPASGCISDIYVGELYQALSSGGPLIAGKSISFTLNTDGVDCSTLQESFWPVLLMINELPFNVR